jgi:hypothetical protein
MKNGRKTVREMEEAVGTDSTIKHLFKSSLGKTRSCGSRHFVDQRDVDVSLERTRIAYFQRVNV